MSKTQAPKHFVTELENVRYVVTMDNAADPSDWRAVEDAERRYNLTPSKYTAIQAQVRKLNRFPNKTEGAARLAYLFDGLDARLQLRPDSVPSPPTNKEKEPWKEVSS